MLLVTSDAATAARLEEELALLLRRAPCRSSRFPGYETLPYDQFSPHPDIISQRLRTLARLPALKRGIVIVDLQTALQRLPPRTFIDGHALSLKVGEALDLEQFRLRLTSAGYASVPQVGEPGDFAIRGSLFDIFPMGADAPLRIDLFDDVIDSIRSFDTEIAALARASCQRLDLLPAREFSLSPEAIKDFRRRFRTRFQGDLTRMPLYRDVGEGLAPAGIEYYLPLFFEQTATLLDYLPERATVILPADHDAGLRDAWRSLVERHEERRYDIEHPVLDPAEICVPADEWLTRDDCVAARPASGRHRRSPARADDAGCSSHCRPCRSCDFRTEPAPSARLDQRREETLHAFAEQLRYTDGRVLLAAESAGRRELLLELLRPYDIAAKVVGNWQEFLDSDARIALTVAPLASGVTLRDPPRHDLRRGTAVRRARAPGTPAAPHRPRSREDHPAARGPASRRAGRARGLRRRPLHRPDDDGRRRHDRRVPGARIRRGRQAVRAGAGARTHQPLHRRARGVRAAAQARRRPVDEGTRTRGGEDPRCGGRTARRLRTSRRTRRATPSGSTTSRCARSRPASRSRRRSTS